MTPQSTPIPHPPPQHCSVPTRAEPYPAGSQEADKLRALHEHFSDGALRLGAKEGGDEVQELDDWEKMYLVSEGASWSRILD